MRPSTKVTLAGYKQYNETPIYEPGPVSKLNLVLWIMPEYNDDISFCWKSKTGAIIQTTDEEFDEEDLSDDPDNTNASRTGLTEDRT